MLIRFLEDSLLVDDSILVIGDMHIGYEECVVGRGLFPRMQLKEIMKKLKRIFKNLDEKKIKLKKIVLLGDLKHEFGVISKKEKKEVSRILNYLRNKIGKNNRIILIEGNHDKVLEFIVRKKEIKIRDYYKVKIKKENKKNEICFLHGHRLFKQCLNSVDVLIIGHLHPSIVLKDEYKKERFKCFLKGKWNRKEVIILPSFSDMSFGFDLNGLDYEEEKNKFCIIENKILKNFEVVIYDNENEIEYNFGKLKKLIE